MNRTLNAGTQPFHTQPVFNNWDAVPLAWYCLGRSRDIKRGAIRPYQLCNQRVVVFRGQDGSLRALDSFCPHMGTDLAIGRVDGNQIRCFFHHWKFDGAGECTDIPCGERKPSRARLQSYDVREKYGFVWIWPEREAAGPVPEFPELAGQEVHAIGGRAYERSCHPTVTMINGLDAQHLRTVHRIPIEMTLKTRDEENGRIMEFRMEAALSDGSFLQAFFKKLLGGRYAYTMRYADATLGLLRTLEDVRWLGRYAAEPTRMIFAYTPLARGRVRVQPIYIARKPGHPGGNLLAYIKLASMAFGFLWLRDEDGKIYDNIRFQPNALLKIDQGVGRFIQYVNSLKLSSWTLTTPTPFPQKEPSHE
jgi:phenylpropionate dioxygenase-like ring-hydroxylating dioxygenase large terminal subunit